MNRKEIAEQIGSIIANNHPNLEPEEIAVLITANEEFNKNCSNCVHQYRNGSRGDYCDYYEYHIPDADEWFCANHQKLALNTQRVILSVDDIESNLKDRVVEMIIEREKKGHKKYGQTMDRRDYTKRDWLTHLLEELLDAAQYAMAADEADLAEQFMYDAMNVLNKIDKLEIV